MLVKGTALHANRKFVLARFGEEGLDRWFAALPKASQSILNGVILETAWYPVVEGLIAPTRAVAELFFAGDINAGAMEVGRFSAEHGLRGIYRIFVKIAPPTVVIDRGTRIIKTYYDPIEMEIAELTKNAFTLRFSKMDAPSSVIDHRIAGWIQRALQICGTQDLVTEVVRSAHDVQGSTEIAGHWS
ncbi:MAG: hypothetical protein AAB426_01230 [Myxococcota bacterium]